MLKAVKPIGMLLFCSTLGTGIVHAATTEITAVKSVQQTSTCRGTVIDATGETVIGASVRVKGTNTGTITDLDGKFELSNVSKGTTLEISYIGFKTI